MTGAEWHIWSRVVSGIRDNYPTATHHVGTFMLDWDDRVVMVDCEAGQVRIGVYPVTDSIVAEDPSQYVKLDMSTHTADQILDTLDATVDGLDVVPLDADGNCTRCGAPQRGCEH